MRDMNDILLICRVSNGYIEVHDYQFNHENRYFDNYEVFRYYDDGKVVELYRGNIEGEMIDILKKNGVTILCD